MNRHPKPRSPEDQAESMGRDYLDGTKVLDEVLTRTYKLGHLTRHYKFGPDDLPQNLGKLKLEGERIACELARHRVNGKRRH